ncbi:hypothetical protein ACFPYJ_25965 [Paenibacillus solisilvae]|uniref:Uncharacterized protein n=1 Tax=Paenibacillus solisilvae TaxID=2486751 RepID=A0ABW0W5I8_9BACL
MVRINSVGLVGGGGILAHPGGIAKGVRSMLQQGCEAAVHDIELSAYAKSLSRTPGSYMSVRQQVSK